MTDKIMNSAAANSVRPLVAWYALFVFALLNAISLIDRTIISVMIPEISLDLGLSDFEISVVQGVAFAVFYGIIGILTGWLADKYSRRVLMFVGMIVWSIAAAMTGLAANFVHLLIARMMVGVGEATISPSSQSMLAEIFPPQKLSFVLSIYVSAAVIGLGASMALGGWLLEALQHYHLPPPLGDLAPWRQILILTGLPGVLIALLIFTVRETVHPIGAGAARGATWRAFGVYLQENRRLVSGILAGYGLTTMTSYAAIAWAPTYARRVLGLGVAEVGSTIGVILGVGGVVGLLSMGYIVDRLFSRGIADAALRCYMVVAAIVLPISVAGFLLDRIGLFYLAVALLQCGLASTTGPALAAIQVISPPEMRGRMAALIVLTTNLLGVACGPMIVGALNDYVYQSPLKVGASIATVVGIAGPLGAFLLWRTRSHFREKMAAAYTH